MTDAITRIEAARRVAALAAPYAAPAFGAARVVLSDCVPIAGCDTSWRVYFNTQIAETMPIPQLAWIWLHEVLGHLVQQHCAITRARGLDPLRANIAQDLAIECWTWPSTVQRPPFGLHPDQYGFPRNLAWQTYYDMLSADTAQASTPNCGSGSHGVAAPWELPADGNGLSELEARALGQAIAQRVRQAGNAPSGLHVWADEVLRPPRPDWRRRLRAHVSALRSGYEDQQGAARVRRGLIYRRWTEPHIRCAIIADTSGSMNGHGGEVLSVVRDTAAILGDVDVCWIDTRPIWQHVRRGGAVTPVGGGGTDLRPAIEEAIKRRYSLIVIVTDCETPWPEPHLTALVLGVGNHTPPKGWRYLETGT